MLGKLLKYELKSTSRMMGVLYLAVLVVAAVVGFIARGMILGATQGNAIAVVISGLIYGLLIVALMIVTIVMVLQRFIKSAQRGRLSDAYPSSSNLDAGCIKSNQLTDLDFTEYCGTVRIHIRSCTDRYAWQWSLFSDRY